MRKGSLLAVTLVLLFSMISMVGGAKKMTQTEGHVSSQSGETKKHPVVDMETSMGNVEIELYADKAPVTVHNFLKYVNEKFYDGTIFHRVIPNFMIQGGGFTADMQQKKTHAPIQNEAGNGLLNDTGTLAMARTNDVNSATAQFFINTHNNAFLNHRNSSAEGFGYAVFGKVIKGMDVVHKIEHVQTGTSGMFQDVPTQPVVIKAIREKNR